MRELEAKEYHNAVDKITEIVSLNEGKSDHDKEMICQEEKLLDQEKLLYELILQGKDLTHDEIIRDSGILAPADVASEAGDVMECVDLIREQHKVTWEQIRTLPLRFIQINALSQRIE